MLGEGGGSAQSAPIGQSFLDFEQVEPLVPVEAAILAFEHRAHQVARKLAQRHKGRVLRADGHPPRAAPRQGRVVDEGVRQIGFAGGRCWHEVARVNLAIELPFS